MWDPDAESEPAAVPPPPSGVDADAAMALDVEACVAILEQWGVPYEAAEDAPESIEMPIRLTGPVEGVSFVIPWAVSNHHDVLDCRLAVVLTEWAVLLRQADIVEVRIFSFYRQGERRGVSSGAAGRLSQHNFGLAVDAGWFVLADGTVLDVRADFALESDAGETCDAEPSNARSAVLVGAFCDAWDAGLFHVQLSPEHNREHRNHFHMDIGGGGGGRYID